MSKKTSLCSDLKKIYNENKREGNPCMAIMAGTAALTEGCKWAKKPVANRVRTLVLKCNK